MASAIGIGCSSSPSPSDDEAVSSDEQGLASDGIAGAWKLDAASVIANVERPVFDELRLYRPTSFGGLKFRGRLKGQTKEQSGSYQISSDGEIRLQWVASSIGGSVDFRIQGSGASRTLRSDIYGTMQYEMQVAALPALPPPPSGADPFDPASCSGASLTDTQALAYFTPGTDAAQIGRYAVLERSRSCSGGSCGAWSTEEAMDFDGGGQVELTIKAGYFGAAPVIKALLAGDLYRYPRGFECGAIGTPKCSDFATTLASTCFRAVKSATTTTPTGETIETERVAFAKLTSPSTPPAPPVVDEPVEFSASSCPGSLSESSALARLAANGGPISLGTYRVLERHRDCNQVTGCGAWVYGTTVDPFADGTATLRLKDLGPNWQYPYVTVAPSLNPSAQGYCGSLGALMSCDASPFLPGTTNYNDVSVGSSCFRAVASSSFMDGAGTTRTTERALLTHY